MQALFSEYRDYYQDGPIFYTLFWKNNSVLNCLALFPIPVPTFCS